MHLRSRYILLGLSPFALFLLVYGGLTYRYLRLARLRPLLIAAIKARDARRTKALLVQGADPDSRDRQETKRRGLRDLFLAILRRDSAARGHRGRTALMLAAGNEDADCVRLLLEHGARVNAIDEHYSTALLEAALVRYRQADIEGNTDMSKRQPPVVREVLKLLLDHGADPNARFGADPTVNGLDGSTALLLCTVFVHRPDCYSLLVGKGAEVNARDSYGSTALCNVVAGGGDIDEVRTLIEHGADVNARGA